MGSERQVRPGLWAMGAVDSLDWGRMVAVIGSRASTAYGDLVAADFAQDFARQGWHVVTGGGFGIETAALHGALAAGATPPVVWSASSFDRPHPPANAALFDQVVAAGGVIVTGVDPALGTSPTTRSAAVQRNDAMLQQAQAVVLVEAAFRRWRRSRGGADEHPGVRRAGPGHERRQYGCPRTDSCWPCPADNPGCRGAGGRAGRRDVPGAGRRRTGSTGLGERDRAVLCAGRCPSGGPAAANGASVVADGVTRDPWVSVRRCCGASQTRCCWVSSNRLG